MNKYRGRAKVVMSLREVLAFSTVILLISSTILFDPTIELFADSSAVIDCSGSFSGNLSEPFNAETMITINAKHGNYDVEFDYAVANGDEGASYFVKSSAFESSPVIFVEGETIFVLLTSGETIPEGAIRLYYQALPSGCI